MYNVYNVLTIVIIFTSLLLNSTITELKMKPQEVESFCDWLILFVSIEDFFLKSEHTIWFHNYMLSLGRSLSYNFLPRSKLWFVGIMAHKLR